MPEPGPDLCPLWRTGATGANFFAPPPSGSGRGAGPKKTLKFGEPLGRRCVISLTGVFARE